MTGQYWQAHIYRPNGAVVTCGVQAVTAEGAMAELIERCLPLVSGARVGLTRIPPPAERAHVVLCQGCGATWLDATAWPAVSVACTCPPAEEDWVVDPDPEVLAKYGRHR